jgi:MFS family permease
MPSPRAVAAAGLAALAVAMGVGRFAFTPILPMMQADAGLSLAQGGWLASANYAGYLLGALTAAALPLSSAAAMRAGLIAIGATTAAMGLDAGFAGWLALRAVSGVASAWVLIHVSAWSLERLAAAGPTLNGVVYAGVGAGSALAGALCLVLMQRGAPSAAAWLILGAVSLVAAAAIWPLLRASGPARREKRATLQWSAAAVRLVACYGVFGFGYIIPATFLPAMARQSLADAALFGWAWPIFGAAACVSTLAAAPLARRFGPRRLWFAAQLVLALGVAAPLALHGLAGIVLAALCVGGTFMVITMAGMQAARAQLGAQAAPLMAAMTAAFAAGQIAGPLAASLLALAGAGLEHVLLAAGVVLVAAALLLLKGDNP